MITYLTSVTTTPWLNPDQFGLIQPYGQYIENRKI